MATLSSEREEFGTSPAAIQAKRGSIPSYFGMYVFDDRVMKARLSTDVYQSVKKTIDEGAKFDRNIASIIADAMKEWAIEKGATHYTHWFQPMTGVTAEKHDSFIEPASDGRVIMNFSGRNLVQGEPDASSFPSGGLRATFEARGYTTWDPTSFAFIKDKTLCIPTAFCSYDGSALDKKTPLLRSMAAINKEALRILRLFGNTSAKQVRTSVGPEQEYFLIDKKQYLKRKDLRFAGRTLFGAKAPKGQEMNDHYFGVIRPRVAAFMSDLNDELWKLGILAKTEHNEVAPAQHELAPIYTTTNVATDHNQLTMEIMKKVADKHDLVCLLHEKPFAGVNGSGKHNNWSISTNDGTNLLSPGDTPEENAQFLLFLVAVIEAVDEYQDLLRMSAATAGNDLRLGANEAPPAVVSIFLGDELTAILESIENDTPYNAAEKTVLKLGVDVLPRFTRDSTDRNRTSPFAFTGNKFEFRMLGSSNSIACANIMLNAGVADVLSKYADELEGAKDFTSALHNLIKKAIKDHKRIIFNGNGYDDEWIKEATEKRGLLNLRTTVDAMPALLWKKNATMLKKFNIFSQAELESRYEIMLENYCKTTIIEANTMIDMTRKDIIPAIENNIASLANTATAKNTIGQADICAYEKKMIAKLSALVEQIDTACDDLENALIDYSNKEDITQMSEFIRDDILPKMSALRAPADQAETLTSGEFWPFPTYGDLIFSV